MAQASREVSEFRGIIDAVIQDRVRQIESGHGTPVGFTDYRKMAKAANGLSFGSLDQHDGRPLAIPCHPEHTWGIATNHKLWHDSQTGHLAVVSTADKPETLTRSWSFDNGYAFNIETQRELTLPDEIEAAVVLARSTQPYQERAALGRLAALTENEQVKLATTMAVHEERSQRLDIELKALGEAQRRAWVDSDRVIVNG